MDEEIEYMRQEIRIDAYARVANAHDSFALVPFHGQADFASRIGVLRRIDEQVHEYLPQSDGVGLQPHRRIGK